MITVAAGFPSTVAPIVQNGLVPVFVDVSLGDYNADPEQLRAAISPRTRAIMLAHTLGVPFDLDTVMDLVEKHDLWFVEDNCDALGSRYRGRLTGTFGHLATSSFYPAHHITTGEGGMVVTERRASSRGSPARSATGAATATAPAARTTRAASASASSSAACRTATTTSTSTATSATT